jgi:hypothetical protein
MKPRVFSEIRDIYCILPYMKGMEFYSSYAILFTKKHYTNNNPYIFRKLGKYSGFLWDYWRSMLFVWYFAFIFLVHKFPMKTRLFSEIRDIYCIWMVYKWYGNYSSYTILFTKKQYTNKKQCIFWKLVKYSGFLWNYWRSMLYVLYFSFIYLVYKFPMKLQVFTEMSGHLLYITLNR